MFQKIIEDNVSQIVSQWNKFTIITLNICTLEQRFFYKNDSFLQFFTFALSIKVRVATKLRILNKNH